jgi:hypothetical protein
MHQTTPGLVSGDVEQVRMAPSGVDPCVGGNNWRLNPIPDVVSCGRRKKWDRRRGGASAQLEHLYETGPAVVDSAG